MAPSPTRYRSTAALDRARRFAIPVGIVLGLACIAAVLIGGPMLDGKSGDSQAIGEFHQPSQWFFEQRAFPGTEIPLETWRAEVRSASTLREAASKRTTLSWTPRGPENIGGRITDIAVDPTDDDIVYAGAAEGGVFKTIDGGLTWTPLFDSMPALSIGAVAIDPNDPDVVYAGTGEVNPGGGSLAYGGAGLFRSTNGGASWLSIGLEDSGTIGRIVVDPVNSQRIFVAVMGHHWETGQDRGVYRTIDGGTTWERVLFVDEQTGCVDLVQRPDNPNVLFAAMWQRLRLPESYDYGGPGCGVYRTDDGGDTWSPVAGGLPAPSTDGGRIGLSLCQGQPDVMHAIYADRTGYFDGLFRSINGGTTWTRTTDGSLSGVFSSYGWWFGNVRTHPTDPDTIYVLGLPFWRSTDGGASYQNASGGMHVDHHALAFGVGDGAAMYNGNDGGVYRSLNGTTWTKSPNLPLTQVYRLATDPNNTDALYLGAQDNGTNRTLTGALDDWVEIYGGDGMQPLVHPNVSTTIWAMYQYGSLVVSTTDGSGWQNATLGIGAGDRVAWNAPHIQDPTDVDTRYFGTNHVYRNTSDRQWEAISPDLTGGPHQGNSGQVDGSLTTLAVSPLDGNVIWAGSNDGLVHVTVNGGGNWSDVSATLPQRWVTSVRSDPFDRETAYVTISGLRWAEPLPHVYRTTNLGSSWTPIAAGLPEVPVNDLLADPEHQGRLFIATDLGVYQSLDGGLSWTMLGDDLPNVVINSLAIDSAGEHLIAGTFGRSTFEIPLFLEQIFADGFETGDFSRWSNPKQ